MNNLAISAVSPVIIASGQTLTVGSSEELDAVRVETGGVLRIESGGRVRQVAVRAGGSCQVASGGTAAAVYAEQAADVGYDFNTSVKGSAENDTIVESFPDTSANFRISDRQTVGDGRIAVGAVVLAGATQEIRSGGEASYSQVRSGGSLLAGAGARVNTAVVAGSAAAGGGSLFNYADISAGGRLTADGGSRLNNTTVAAGGRLELAAGTTLGGITRIGGRTEAAGTITVDGTINFAPDAATGNILLVNDLTQFSGVDFSITIPAETALSAGEYRLAGNAAGFTGGIRCVGTDFLPPLGVLDLNAHPTLMQAGQVYTLALNSADELVLRVRALTDDDHPIPAAIGPVRCNVYTGMAVTIDWDEPVSGKPIAGYQVRVADSREALAGAAVRQAEDDSLFLDNLADGSYFCQVRAVDDAGTTGTWSEVAAFTIAAGSQFDTMPVLTTELWGHDYLSRLYDAPAPQEANDVTGYYFADAEKLNIPQDSLYCWAASSANLLTWSGWAANSPYAFRNEDETLEYFINYWPNTGDRQADALSWFFDGSATTGATVVPADGGALFPTLKAQDYFRAVSSDSETSTLLELITDYFDAGYGLSFALFSDDGLAHAITGWGYERDEKNQLCYLYYSDSDSDCWSGSYDRSEAVNRLSRTRAEVRDDGHLHLLDYMDPDAYIGVFTALSQFDRAMLGERETFADARLLTESCGETLRAGNLDSADDDDYYMFTTRYAGEVTLSLELRCPEAGAVLSVAVYDEAHRQLYRSAAGTAADWRFQPAAPGRYYLLVTGSASAAESVRASGADNYLLSLTVTAGETTWRAFGISADDDTWERALSRPEFTVTAAGGTPDFTAKTIFRVTDPATGEVFPNWVGAADLRDLRAMRVDRAGTFDFTVDFAKSPGKLSLSIYRLDGNRLVRLRSITVGSAMSDAARGIRNLRLDSGLYFVQAYCAAAGGAFYDVDISGQIFTRADRSDDSIAAAAADPDCHVTTGSGTGGRLSETSLFGENWVGFGDQIDFRRLDLTESGSYDFAISRLDARARGSLTLWQVNDRGTVLRKFTVAGSTARSVSRNHVLLEAGTYYVSFQSNSWAAGANTDYRVSISGDVFQRGDNRDDSAAAIIGDPAFRVTVGVPDDGVLDPVSLFGDNWVGFGDKIDYRQLELAENGRYNFSISRLDARARGSFTLWKMNDRGQLSRVFSTAGSTARSVSRNHVLLEAGTYFVSFQSNSWAVGANTDYNVSLSGTLFSQRDNRDDTIAAIAGRDDCRISVRPEAAGPIEAVSLFGDNWVGFGDKIDYRQLELAVDGSYRFTVSRLDARARGSFTLWKMNDRGQLLRVFSVAGSTAREIVRDQVKLAAGSYFVSFQSNSWAIGANTGYDVLLAGVAAAGTGRTAAESDFGSLTAAADPLPAAAAGTPAEIDDNPMTRRPASLLA